MLKGKTIDHVAAFSPYTGAWAMQHLLKPVEDEINPVIGPGSASIRPATTFTPSVRDEEPGVSFIWKTRKKPRPRPRPRISRSFKGTGCTFSALSTASGPRAWQSTCSRRAAAQVEKRQHPLSSDQTDFLINGRSPLAGHGSTALDFNPRACATASQDRWPLRVSRSSYQPVSAQTGAGPGAPRTGSPSMLDRS